MSAPDSNQPVLQVNLEAFLAVAHGAEFDSVEAVRALCAGMYGTAKVLLTLAKEHPELFVTPPSEPSSVYDRDTSPEKAVEPETPPAKKPTKKAL